VLLLSLLITGLIATMTLSFANSMGTQIQVSRDEAATLHADLAAQSGLEYAKGRLRIDPLWTGTVDGPMMFTEEGFFTVTRKEGQGSKILPTQVGLILEGQLAESFARYETELSVNPGDPLLDKAVSVLGDISGSNIRIDGDYLVLDAPGWLWTFHVELIPEVEADPRLAETDLNEDQLEIDTRTESTKDSEPLTTEELSRKSHWYWADGDWSSNWTSSDGDTLDKSSDWNWDDWKWSSLSDTSDSTTTVKTDTLTTDSTKTETITEVVSTSIIDDTLMHVRKEDYVIEGVWLRSPEGGETYVALDRVDAPGVLNNFSETLYAWAENQEKEQQPVHAPGWDFDRYLVPSPDIRVFDHVTEVKDLVLDETAVFLLDPGQELNLRNVDFRGGAVVWTESDYDFSGEPRNPVILGGSNSFGRSTSTSENIGLLAPGSSIEVLGANRHDTAGYSVVHSLKEVKRFHHVGVLIVLNSATDVQDSSFLHDPSIAANPPDGLIFFGDLPSVRVEQLIESYDAPPLP
jgi:hypothetical protein